MAKGFISIAPRGEDQSDTIVNVFWYSLELGLETSPSTTQMQTLLTNWITLCKGKYLAGLPITYSMIDITARAYTVTGTPSEVLPVIDVETGAGSQNNERDTNVHCAIIRFGMGNLVAFSGQAGPLRSSRLMYGPILSNVVGNDGTISTAGWGGTVAADLISIVTTNLTVAVAGDAECIRVSKVVNHVPTNNVASYRKITSAAFAPKAGFQRRRTNLR